MTVIAAYASVMTDKLATVCMLSKEASFLAVTPQENALCLPFYSIL